MTSRRMREYKSADPELIELVARLYYDMTKGDRVVARTYHGGNGTFSPPVITPATWESEADPIKDRVRNTVCVILGIAERAGALMPAEAHDLNNRLEQMEALFAAMSSALEEAETEAENLRLDTN